MLCRDVKKVRMSAVQTKFTLANEREIMTLLV